MECPGASFKNEIWRIGGFVLILLGILGEYVGLICDETEGRPLYIVRGRETAAKSVQKGRAVDE